MTSTCPVCREPMKDGVVGPHCVNRFCPVLDDGHLWKKRRDGMWERLDAKPPEPLAEFTISIYGDRTKTHVTATARGLPPEQALRSAIAALEAELEELGKCPAHGEGKSHD